MALEIRLNSVPHFKALLMVKTYLVGKGIVEHLGSFIYCQITLILIHKRAYRSRYLLEPVYIKGNHDLIFLSLIGI